VVGGRGCRYSQTAGCRVQVMESSRGSRPRRCGPCTVLKLVKREVGRTKASGGFTSHNVHELFISNRILCESGGYIARSSTLYLPHAASSPYHRVSIWSRRPPWCPQLISPSAQLSPPPHPCLPLLHLRPVFRRPRQHLRRQVPVISCPKCEHEPWYTPS
jgi:hypothetical protein